MTAFVAYELHRDSGFRLVAASPDRAWMRSTPQRFANRCLPLLMANQAGWFVLNNATVTLTWTGGRGADAIGIDYGGPPPVYRAVSHFGDGVVTWSLPYLFRTPPGYDLLVRGPANWPRDGAFALEGLVEADSTAATFTMSWKLTRPGAPVRFAAAEPLCMVVPQRRAELEEFRPELRHIGADPEVNAAYTAWQRDRTRFLAELAEPGSEAAHRGWQKTYVHEAQRRRQRLPGFHPPASRDTPSDPS